MRVYPGKGSTDIFAAANNKGLASDNYIVDVEASAVNNYNINSVDINFTFDSSKFEWVGTKIDNNFDIFNTTEVDESVKGSTTLRVVGGSAEQFGGDAGQGLKKEADNKSAFQVLLKAIHDEDAKGNEQNINFETTLNSTGYSPKWR